MLAYMIHFVEIDATKRCVRKGHDKKEAKTDKHVHEDDASNDDFCIVP